MKRVGPRWPAFYETTERCKKFLTGCEGLAPGFVFRLHKCVFKYPILEEPTANMNWRRGWDLNPWEPYGSQAFKRMGLQACALARLCDPGISIIEMGGLSICFFGVRCVWRGRPGIRLSYLGPPRFERFPPLVDLSVSLRFLHGRRVGGFHPF